MAGDPIARTGVRSLALVREFLPRCRQATVVAAPAYPRRCDRRVRAGQRAMADCGAVSMGATDDPVRMRNGMIQINTAARLPPKELAQ